MTAWNLQAGSGRQHNTEIEDGVSHLEILPREEKQLYWKCKTPSNGMMLHRTDNIFFFFEVIIKSRLFFFCTILKGNDENKKND